MANEIYHRSNWGNAVNDIAWGDVYEKFDATNEMFVRSDNYENSNETDKLMAAINPKPSILLTPTAYDNGSLHSVKPVQSFGSELVTNGDFATDSDWNKGTGWSISGGSANCDGTQTSGTNLIQPSLSLGTNKIFKIEFELKDYQTGELIFVTLTGTGALEFENINANGTYVAYSGLSTGNNSITFSADADFIGSIDNVSVKEVIDADFDFTRGSSATRVNEQGLIEDVQILSGELVQNGDFEQIGSELITNGGFDTDSDWQTQTGWSISNGKANAISAPHLSRLTQVNLGQNINRPYKITFTVSNLTEGNFKVWFGTAQSDDISNDGDYVIYLTPTTTQQFFIYANGTTTGSIDNVSVKEVGQNWTFGTGWSIEDGKAIFNGFSNQSLAQDGIVANNKKYKLTYTISNYVQGGINWRFGTSSNLTTVRSANGTYVEEITSTGSDFRGISSGASELSIDNVSVIEITDDTDLPRIDYTNGTGSLLLEPQSTNLLPYSEDFSQWNANGDTVIESGYLAPDGSNTAYKVTGSTANLNYTSISNTTQTRTIWARTVSGTGQAHLCSWYGNTNNLFTITEQWQRFEVNGTTSSTGATSFYAIDFRGSTDLTEVIIWGAQLEALSYATSYIPTNGSTVTRLADVCNNSGSSDLINSTEGVLYAEIAALADDLTSRVISLSDGTANERVVLQYHNTTNRIRCFIKSGGSFYATLDKVVSDITDFHKIAYKYKSGETKLFVDGSLITSSSNTFSITGLNVLQFANGTPTASPLQGKVKSVAVFKEALTDEELTALTT